MGARLLVGARWFGYPWDRRPRDYRLRPPDEPPLRWIEFEPIDPEIDERIQRFRVWLEEKLAG